MKRRGMAVGAVILLGASLLGASVYAEEAALPQLSYEEFPRMDGSLACVPMLEKLAETITGCSESEAEKLLDHFSNTNPSYLSVASGTCDFSIAYEPAAETKQTLTEYAPLTMEPIGRDALVFMVNKDNPVDSITSQQAHDIYTGKITNWKELGGDDVPIMAFTRPETSGSQTLMRKLLLGEEEMIPAKTMMVDSMEGIIEELRNYDNSSSAIGYSVYYYASQMFGQPDLKFLQIDDVAPDNDSIGDGTYTLVNDFYFVTSEASADSAKEIARWMITPDGQKFVEECGYVSLQGEE